MPTPEPPPEPRNPKPSPDDRFNDPVARALWQILLATRFVLPAVLLYLAFKFYLGR
jgi:hypothetical protein